MSDAFVLPSAGPEAIPFGTALAAVLGYAHGRRPLQFRSPSASTGRWVQVPAFGYERFDVRARSDGPLGEPDILPAAEKVAWTIGRLVVWSNDLLRSLVGNDIPDLQHAAQFLAWAKTRPALSRD